MISVLHRYDLSIIFFSIIICIDIKLSIKINYQYLCRYIDDIIDIQK